MEIGKTLSSIIKVVNICKPFGVLGLQLVNLQKYLNGELSVLSAPNFHKMSDRSWQLLPEIGNIGLR